jgi:hypothetical protein
MGKVVSIADGADAVTKDKKIAGSAGKGEDGAVKEGKKAMKKQKKEEKEGKGEPADGLSFFSRRLMSNPSRFAPTVSNPVSACHADSSKSKVKKAGKEGKRAREEGADDNQAARKKAKKASKPTSSSEESALTVETMVAEDAAADPLALENIPQLNEPIKSLLRAKGINALFPIQVRRLWSGWCAF